MSERLAYTVAEFAAAIGRKPTTVLRWLQRGELAGRKIGGVWVIPVDALEAYDADREGPQRGQPVPSEPGREVDRHGHDAGRPPEVAVRRVQGRGPGEPAGRP